jgi:hypothetical protein
MSIHAITIDPGQGYGAASAASHDLFHVCSAPLAHPYPQLLGILQAGVSLGRNLPAVPHGVL